MVAGCKWGGVHTEVGSGVLKVIPDIISQWEQEERGDGNHYYTLSKDEKGIGSNAFCLSSVLVFLFLPHVFFLLCLHSNVFLSFRGEKWGEED